VTTPSGGQPIFDLLTESLPSATIDPFSNFQCAFGFTGPLATPAAVPTTKADFLQAINKEILCVGELQRGLQSYQSVINSRKHYTFSVRFLIDQNTATIITIDQLDKLGEHLKKVEMEVEAITGDVEDDGKGVGEGVADGEDVSVSEDFVKAYEHAQPWIMRARAILRHCHVFYKINFVLASGKKSTRQ
jgi:hypothetical protein